MHDSYFTQLHCVISLHLLQSKAFFPLFFFSFYYVRLSGNLWLAFNPDMCNKVLFASGKVKRRIIWQSEGAFFSKEIVHNVLFCRLLHCYEEFLYGDNWNDPICLNSSVSAHDRKSFTAKTITKGCFKRNLVATWSGFACHHVSRFCSKKLVFVTVFLRGNQTSQQTSFH